jgi:hypothetical protein
MWTLKRMIECRFMSATTATPQTNGATANCNQRKLLIACYQATPTSTQPYVHALHHISTVSQSSQLQLPSRAQASSRVPSHHVANRKAVRRSKALSAHRQHQAPATCMQVLSQQNLGPVGTPPYTRRQRLNYLGCKIRSRKTRLLRPNAT